MGTVEEQIRDYKAKKAPLVKQLQEIQRHLTVINDQLGRFCRRPAKARNHAVIEELEAQRQECIKAIEKHQSGIHEIKEEHRLLVHEAGKAKQKHIAQLESLGVQDAVKMKFALGRADRLAQALVHWQVEPTQKNLSKVELFLKQYQQSREKK